MGALIPLIHCRKHFIGLAHDQDRSLGDGVQLRIGDDDRDFDDAIPVRIESGHFHVQPEKVVLVLRHAAFPWALCRMALSHNRLRSMHWFTAVFIAALALSTVVRLWLSRRHIRYVLANRDAVPAEFSASIPLAAHQKAAD